MIIMTIPIIQKIFLLLGNESASIGEWIKLPNSIIALNAIIISLFSLIFSIYHNRKTLRLTEKHNMLSVRPILQISGSVESKSGIIEYRVKNEGLGPALIQKINFKYDDNFFDNINDLLNDLQPRMASKTQFKLDIKFKKIFPNTVISSNNALHIFKIKVNPEMYTNSLGDLLEKVNMNILYEDMYGKRYENDI